MAAAAIGIEGPGAINAACRAATAWTLKLIAINAGHAASEGGPAQNESTPSARQQALAGRSLYRSLPAITRHLTDLPRHTLPIWFEADGEARVLHRFQAQAGQPGMRAGDAAPIVTCIRLEGIAPDAVLRLRILQGDKPVYDLTGYQDTRGRLVSAGSLILSMAWLEGREGMSILTLPMRMTLPELTVEVQALVTDESSMRAAVRVELQT